MNSKNDTTNRVESIYAILTDVSSYYGLIWQQVRSGILVYNGTDYFLIKLKGTKVRKLYHQNHNRTIKQKVLPCGIEEIDNLIIQQYFHQQLWKDIDCCDLKRTLVYIYRHGNARQIQDSHRKAFLQAAFA
ncbi:MAG: hypothetical protein K0R31_1353 [Clostridiales bacterium]|jgi:hypothetical protein|nr:hypothetical protein [Clostridiales bacterium]